MCVTLLLVVLCCVCIGIVLVADTVGRNDLRGIAKICASLCFIAVGISAGMLSYDPVAIGLFAALVLSFIGDAALIGKSRRAVAFGLVAFLLAHVAYIVCFALRGVSAVEVGVGTVVIAGLAVIIWRWLSPHTGRLRPAVAAYIVVISVMVIGAAGSVFVGDTGRILLGMAVLFFLSDLCVARQRFVAPSLWNRRIGLPLYYAAQLGFAHWLLAP